MPRAYVIGSGPNGLAAAITLGRAGRSVVVLEASDVPGGAVRTAELTLPGFRHDVCSSVYPLAVSSPFFRRLALESHGLSWIHPSAPLAHPLDDGSVVLLDRSVDATAEQLGRDEARYRSFISPLVRRWPTLIADVLAPIRQPLQAVRLSRFAWWGVRSAADMVKRLFAEERTRALFAGLAAHSLLPLDMRPSAAFSLVLGTAAHAVGWPFARGGAQRITDALVAALTAAGGSIETGSRVDSLVSLPERHLVLCDVTPRQLVNLAGPELSPSYRRALAHYRYGPGVFKMDWALDGPVPWTAQACSRAGTVHVGGSFDEIARSERQTWLGSVPDEPFVIVAQPSLFDDTRAPAGRHVLWGYCHVPHASTADMTDRIEAQIERFAPGFRDRILARHVFTPAHLERHNPNLVGGDINGGVQDLRQVLLRPTWRAYETPVRGVFICSASTPPGGGVHGMCGHLAARAALAHGW